jgi:energy-coupling factor transport system ATP-binding protein
VCDALSHRYLKGSTFEHPGIEDVTFTLTKGQSLALIGQSGSGKSTLLRHCNAILLPTSGHIRIFGKDTLDARIPLESFRKQAVLAVQNPEAALFEPFVADDVAYGPRNHGYQGKELLRRVQDALEEVGLSYKEFGNRYTRSLSGGEKRRVALAGVLAIEGELFLFDEPTAALDGAGRHRIMQLVSALRQTGHTVVATTHSMEEACLFDRVGVLRDGRLVAFGTPQEIFIQSWDPSWGLSLPWIVQTALAVQKLGKEHGLTFFADRLPLRVDEFITGIQDVTDDALYREHSKMFQREQKAQEALQNMLQESQEALQGMPQIQMTPYTEPRRVLQGVSQTSAIAAQQANQSLIGVQSSPHKVADTHGMVPTVFKARKGTGIEFFKTMPIGLFVDVDSPLQRLSAGWKVVVTAILGVVVLLLPGSLYVLGICAGILGIGVVFGKLSCKYLLRGVVSALPYLGILLFFQFIFSWPGDTSPVLFSWWLVSITIDELIRAGLLLSRLVTLMILLSLFLAVTPPSEVLHWLARWVEPLERFKIPVKELFLVVEIALRFIPILVEEAERIVVAQLSRGGGYQGKHKIQAALALVVPLFLRALERAEALASAMELRLFHVNT